MPDLKGVRVQRIGLHLGEVKGKVSVPDHAAALCFRSPETNSVDLESEEAVKYMAGETIPGDAEGWILLRYYGLAVGWGKGSEGMIKNHYPKGLRGHLFVP